MPWAGTEIELLPPGETPRLLDNSYLTEDDLANPDISANVQAIEDTFRLITWIAQTSDTAYGYWRGPNNVDLSDAPLVSYDTEGQFHLVGANNITEALADAATELGEDWDEIVAACRIAGVTDDLRDIDEWTIPETSPAPMDYHASRYREYRN